MMILLDIFPREPTHNSVSVHIVGEFPFVIPIGVWWIKGIEPFLLQMGQSEELSIMTANYLRVLTLGLLFYSINWTLTSWLQAIEIAHVQAYAAHLLADQERQAEVPDVEGTCCSDPPCC